MWKRAIPAILLVIAGSLWLAAAGAPGIPEDPAGPGPKGGDFERKLGQALARLARTGDTGAAVSAAGTNLRQATPSRHLAGLSLVRDRVLLDATAQDDSARLLAQLEQLGLEHGAVYGRMVSGRLPVASLAAAALLPELRFARPARPSTRAGTATSQGDAAAGADLARSLYGLDGTGVTVGILSDSFDCAGTQTAADIAGGDLPAATTVLDDTGCPGNDEGRSMAQVIHDVAPGAAILNMLAVPLAINTGLWLNRHEQLRYA